MEVSEDRELEGSTPPKVRLVKVLVQPFLVLDDGESLQELTAQTIQVNAADWDAWADKVFSPESLAKIAGEVQQEPQP